MKFPLPDLSILGLCCVYIHVFINAPITKAVYDLSTRACIIWGYVITNLYIAVCKNWCVIFACCICRNLFDSITMSKFLLIYFQLIRISWRRWSMSWRLPWRRSNMSRNTWRSEREYTAQVRHPLHWSCDQAAYYLILT